eukprot:gene4861-6884_t
MGWESVLSPPPPPPPSPPPPPLLPPPVPVCHLLYTNQLPPLLPQTAATAAVADGDECLSTCRPHSRECMDECLSTCRGLLRNYFFCANLSEPQFSQRENSAEYTYDYHLFQLVVGLSAITPMRGWRFRLPNFVKERSRAVALSARLSVRVRVIGCTRELLPHVLPHHTTPPQATAPSPPPPATNQPADSLQPHIPSLLTSQFNSIVICFWMDDVHYSISFQVLQS